MGSESITVTLAPASARVRARTNAEVDFPAPPLGFANTTTGIDHPLNWSSHVAIGCLMGQLIYVWCDMVHHVAITDAAAPAQLPTRAKPPAGMFTTTRTQENRGRGALAALTPWPGKDGGKRRIAVLAHQEADGDDDLAAAAVQLQPALRW